MTAGNPTRGQQRQQPVATTLVRARHPFLKRGAKVSDSCRCTLFSMVLLIVLGSIVAFLSGISYVSIVPGSLKRFLLACLLSGVAMVCCGVSLCCLAHKQFYKLPPDHPERTKYITTAVKRRQRNDPRITDGSQLRPAPAAGQTAASASLLQQHRSSAPSAPPQEGGRFDRFPTAGPERGYSTPQVTGGREPQGASTPHQYPDDPPPSYAEVMRNLGSS